MLNFVNGCGPFIIYTFRAYCVDHDCLLNLDLILTIFAPGIDRLALYNLYNTSKYPIGFAIVILVSEKEIFEVQFYLFILPPPNCTNIKSLVLRVMHTKFGHNWPTTFKRNARKM